MKEFLAILLNTLGILAIVVFGAFILVLVIDLILTMLDGNRDGIIIKHSKNCDKSQPTLTNKTFNEVMGKEEKTFAQIVEPVVEDNEENEYSPIDMQKALEEQRLLEEKMNANKAQPVVAEEPIFTNLEKMVADDDEEDFFADEGEEELTTILESLSKQIAEDDATQKVKEAPIIEETPIVEEPVVIEETPVVEPVKEELPEVQPVVEVQPRTIVKEKIVYLDDHENIKELRKLRKEVLVNKNEALQKMNEDEERERMMDEQLRELEELKNFKKKVQSEKGQNIRNRVKNLSENTEIAAENEKQRLKNKKLEEEKAKLAQEKEELAQELKTIKETPVESDKPYFTRDYYVSKLDALEKELADTNKELRANKREYNPIVKCKKALARDGEKLRKKEVQVAKQKIALFGVNASKNVDPEKKQKLEEDMAILKELKDSVLHCEDVIKQNADRFPILEKTNKLLTKQVNRLTNEISTVQDAIKWYDEH